MLKRRRDKAFAALIALSAAMGVAACSGSSPAGGSASGSGKSLIEPHSAHGSLTLWITSNSSDASAVKAQVAGFEKLYPHITVKVEETATAGNDPGTLSAAAAGKLPDIMRAADVDTYFFAEHGLLLNLTPYMKAYGYKEAQFVQGIMNLGQYKSNQYVIPRSFDEAVVAYNPQVLRKFGLPDPTEGMTWATFQKDACAVNKSKGGVQYYGVGNNLGSPGGVGAAGSYIMYDPFMESTGGGPMNASETKATFDSAASLKGLTTLSTFARNCTSWMDNLPKGTDPFTVGKAAFDVVVRPQVAGWENNSNNAWSGVKFPVNIVNFPLLSPTPKVGAGMVGFAATSQTKDPKAAAAFEMYLLSNAGELVRSKAVGSVPIALDLKNSTAWQDAYNFTKSKYGYTFNAAAFDSYTGDIATPPAKLQLGASGTPPTAVANAWAEIQLHKASVAQAFTAANNKINNWLATQGG
jgi:ABC-type glycerol-3-phosphate transport system substrate-binding protein